MIVDRPAPSSTYSATSQLLNVDVEALGNLEEYFGYAVKGAQIVGETSGAVATVTNIDLFSDNWGDLLGAFFFRDANQTPRTTSGLHIRYKDLQSDCSCRGCNSITRFNCTC